MKWNPKTMVSVIAMTQSLSDTRPSKHEVFAYLFLELSKWAYSSFFQTLSALQHQ